MSCDPSLRIQARCEGHDLQPPPRVQQPDDLRLRPAPIPSRARPGCSQTQTVLDAQVAVQPAIARSGSTASRTSRGSFARIAEASSSSSRLLGAWSGPSPSRCPTASTRARRWPSCAGIQRVSVISSGQPGPFRETPAQQHVLSWRPCVTRDVVHRHPRRSVTLVRIRSIMK